MEDIQNIFEGNEKLQDVIHRQIIVLKNEMSELSSALDVCTQIEKENVDIQTFPEEQYWNAIQNKEKQGESFADICKDSLEYELEIFGGMWKRVFFHDFNASKNKHGLGIAFAIVLVLCVLRGLSRQFLWKSNFLDGFLYPFQVFLIASIILLPIFLLRKKYAKLAEILATILLVASVLLLTAIGIAFVVLLINAKFHFLF